MGRALNDMKRQQGFAPVAQALGKHCMVIDDDIEELRKDALAAVADMRAMRRRANNASEEELGPLRKVYVDTVKKKAAQIKALNAGTSNVENEVKETISDVSQTIVLNLTT